MSMRVWTTNRKIGDMLLLIMIMMVHKHPSISRSISRLLGDKCAEEKGEIPRKNTNKVSQACCGLSYPRLHAIFLFHCFPCSSPSTATLRI